MSGNTPAYAGKTQTVANTQPKNRKHPRLRGEDRFFQCGEYGELETPPLTRGRRRHARRVGGRLGNTPAYAGKTNDLGKRYRGNWKHPRLRGEDLARVRAEKVLLETPPLTRGRPSAIGRSIDERRNTPAYAGKTRRLRSSPRRHWKHPRLRGEDRKESETRRLYGKHPRLRGEDESRKRGHRPVMETPPLTRGRPTNAVRITGYRGNTPAYAGKTKCAVQSPAATKKHPRLRGEDKQGH